MSGRRSSFLNYAKCLSSDVVQIANRYNNANMAGATHGWFKFTYNDSTNKMKAEFFIDVDDVAAVAESTEDTVTGSEQTLTLTEIDSSNVSGTVKFNGASVVMPGLMIWDVELVQIGKTSLKISYKTNKDTKCTVYYRTDAGPGEWQTDTTYASEFHSTHTLHGISSGLSPATWYHFYISAVDQGANTVTWPPYPPNYYRFKTASDTESGVDDGIETE